MVDSILKKHFPSLTEEDIKRIHSKIGDKCNDFYFVEFLKATRGNIDDAYGLFKFDEELRSLLLKYILRFEIQIKSDFMSCLIKATDDERFWENEDNYIFGSHDEFEHLKQKIHEAFANLNVPSSHKDSYAVAYVISFGTFVSLFKYIKPELKKGFIKKYSKKLFKKKDFQLLNKYLLCIRALRNRCAHGTHIVSNSFVNQLAQYSFIKKEENVGPGYEYYTVLELTLKYLIDMIYCTTEFKTVLIALLTKRRALYTKYGGRQSINPTIVEKLS